MSEKTENIETIGPPLPIDTRVIYMGQKNGDISVTFNNPPSEAKTKEEEKVKQKQTQPPVIRIGKHDPLQDYYVDEDGHMYNVARLIDETKHLQPFDCPLAALDTGVTLWGNQRTVLNLAWHFKRVQEADLEKPIILDWRGHVADGRHRIIKALVEGKETIPAVRMDWVIDPCRRAPDSDG
jgi:hypothetical protein